MFGRKKDDPVVTPVEVADDLKDAGKGRATPKRKDAEAARRSPVISGNPSGDKNAQKAARAAQREADRAKRVRENEALITNDQRYLPVAHRGPARQFLRNWVDSRWLPGQLTIPLAFLVLILLYTGQYFLPPAAHVPVIFGLYAVVILAIVHSVFVARKANKVAAEKFGKVPRGLMYTLMRIVQPRRMRLPKPIVKRGEPVE